MLTVLLHESLKGVELDLAVVFITAAKTKLAKVNPAEMLGRDLRTPSIDGEVVAPDLAVARRAEDFSFEG